MNAKTKVKTYPVLVTFDIRARAGATIQMTEAQYREWCERIDQRPRNSEREEMAEELFELCGIRPNDIDMRELEYDEFFCKELEQTP